MKKTIQPSLTVKIDECETSIFYDGSIIVNAAEIDLLCIDFRDIEILFQKATKIRDTNQATS
jgi:ABC-type uncharacterized transport system YnjBCD ATPase subunit